MADESAEANKANEEDYIAVHPSYKNAANETDVPLYADDEERELYEKFGQGPEAEIVGGQTEDDEANVASATASAKPELKDEGKGDEGEGKSSKEGDNPSKPSAPSPSSSQKAPSK